jgi:hypothetical protein
MVSGGKHFIFPLWFAKKSKKVSIGCHACRLFSSFKKDALFSDGLPAAIGVLISVSRLHIFSMLRSPSSFLGLACALGLALGSLLTSPRAQAQSQADIIGFYRFQAPAGVSLWTCALTTKKQFQGIPTGVTPGFTSTITRTGAGWAPNAFLLHYVEIVDGPWAGLVLDIVSNTATTLTVQGDIGQTGFNLGATFTFAIRKHATLGTIFHRGAGLNAFDDSITLLYDNGSRKKFYYDDTAPGHIVGEDFTTIQDTEIVYPGQGMLLNCSGVRSLTFGEGEVRYIKDTPTKIPLYAGKVNFVGLMNPVVAPDPLGTISAGERSSLGSVALGLVNSNLSEYDDLISLYGRKDGIFSSLGLFYYDQAAGAIVDTDGVPASISIPHGTAFTIKPTGNGYYTQPAVVVGP